MTRSVMRGLSFLVLLGLLAVALTFGQSAYPSEAERSAFNSAYWLAQPPEVRALPGMPDEPRNARALELAAQGVVVDLQIHVWRWDPFTTMYLRREYGYTWTPSLLQPTVTLAPGLWFPGMPQYDAKNIPPGAIKVSTSVADFPPFDPPKPAPPPVGNAKPVCSPAIPGNDGVGSLWLSCPGEAFATGSEFTDPRGTFLKSQVATIGGFQRFWRRTR